VQASEQKVAAAFDDRDRASDGAGVTVVKAREVFASHVMKLE
jgi:hypothetical protein